jgi:hypothetical protein
MGKAVHCFSLKIVPAKSKFARSLYFTQLAVSLQLEALVREYRAGLRAHRVEFRYQRPPDLVGRDP